MLKLN